MGRGQIHVLQLIKGLDRGGAETLLTEMVKLGGDDVRYEVAFVRTDMAMLAPSLRDAGIPVHDLGARSDFDVAWTRRLRRLLMANRFDIMHSHLPYAAGLGRAVTRTMPRDRRPRLVYTEHSLWTHNTGPSRVLGRTTSRWDDARIAVAETNLAALPAALQRNTRVIIHGVVQEPLPSPAARQAIRDALGVPEDHLIALSVANLRPEKGHQTLLAAARIVLDAGLPVTFLAAGSGPLEAELTAEHSRLRLGEQFRFLGQRPDARALMAASDLFVLPSDYECMPVSIMEAFAQATPIVATAVGELPLVIQNGVNGLLVEPGQPEALGEAIIRVLQDHRLRETLAAGSRSSAERFDISHTRDEVETVYAELVAV